MKNYIAQNLTHKRCQCRACGEVFSTVSNFDWHRIGNHGKDRRCMTQEEMKNMKKTRLKQNDNGVWVLDDDRVF